MVDKLLIALPADRGRPRGLRPPLALSPGIAGGHVRRKLGSAGPCRSRLDFRGPFARRPGATGGERRETGGYSRDPALRAGTRGPACARCVDRRGASADELVELFEAARALDAWTGKLAHEHARSGRRMPSPPGGSSPGQRAGPAKSPGHISPGPKRVDRVRSAVSPRKRWASLRGAVSSLVVVRVPVRREGPAHTRSRRLLPGLKTWTRPTAFETWEIERRVSLHSLGSRASFFRSERRGGARRMYLGIWNRR